MKQRGFTLIETLLVMVVLGIASATVISLQGGIFAGQSSSQDLQMGTQIVQECAEQVLALRRRAPSGGYAAVTPAACSTLGNVGGFGLPLITLRDDTGADLAACSALGNVGGFGLPLITLRDDTGADLAACASTYCTANITVGKGGSFVAPITLRLRKY